MTEIEGRLLALRTDVDGMAPTVAEVTALKEQVAALMAQLAAPKAEKEKAKGPGRPKMSDEEKAAKAAEKAAAKPKKEKPAAEPVGEAPDLEIYKIKVPVDASLCMARLITEPDDRWSKNVYHEKQCPKKPVEDELCATCAKRLVKYLEKPDWKSGWNGRIDEDPADDEQLTLSVHMPGTKWFTEGPVTWSGTNKSKSASPEKAAAASAAKEAKAAEKAAAKAAKDAEKEAAKEAKAAAKESKPKKEAKAKTSKAAVGGGGAAAAAAESVAAVEETPVTAGYEMCLIDGELRVHKNGNVFELDELTQEPGDYLGRLTGSSDNYGIDADADQVMSDEE
jgi:hypothetical protein